jgi:prepilin-type N-terminal cleavage/methylation domain-containing protein
MKKQYGFSMVEVLLSMAVFAVSVLGLTSVQNNSAENSAAVKEHAEALSIAQAKLELLQSFSKLVRAPGEAVPDLSEVLKNEELDKIYFSDMYITQNDTEFTVSGLTTDYIVKVDTLKLTFPTRVDIKVEVTWTDRNGREQTVDLSSVVSSADPVFTANTLASISGGTPGVVGDIDVLADVVEEVPRDELSTPETPVVEDDSDTPIKVPIMTADEVAARTGIPGILPGMGDANAPDIEDPFDSVGSGIPACKFNCGAEGRRLAALMDQANSALEREQERQDQQAKIDQMRENAENSGNQTDEVKLVQPPLFKKKTEYAKLSFVGEAK